MTKIGLAAVVIGVGAVAAGARLSFLANDRVAPGVYAGSIKVGGLTRPEAADKIREWSYHRLTDKLTFQVGDRNWSGALQDMGVAVDVAGVTDSVYSIGRKGSFLKKAGDWIGLSPRSRKIPIAYKYDWKKMATVVDKMDKVVGNPAQDATISFSDAGRHITPEVPGTTIDFDAVDKLIQSSVQTGKDSVALPIVVAEPEVRAADLKKVDTLLARYVTRYSARKKDRTHNVRLAVNRVDGKLIKPNGVFSYNDTVGPRTKTTGFKDAIIYVRGKMKTDTGGGICQVSSTLYNAALLAGLEIVERSNHSMPVPYVPLGRDATVAYGFRDLKFKNTSTSPIYVMAKIGASYVTVDLYGASDARKEIKIITSKPKKFNRNGKVITTVTAYRVFCKDGTEVSRERLSRDRYLPPAPHPVEPKPKKVKVASA